VPRLGGGLTLAGPALSQCVGPTPDGLPPATQVMGRPIAGAQVRRVADARGRAMPWRGRRPALVACACPLPPVPDPTPAEISAAERDIIALVDRRAGLTLNERSSRCPAPQRPLSRPWPAR
jgi:aspartyl-tRNA(Asn)/glutamyl-tRNA(Gln) amidotransferase subunit A